MHRNFSLDYIRSEVMKLFVISLLVFTSCSVSKKMTNTKDLTIILTKTECGGYEVMNKEQLVGYVVKPFYVEVEKKEKYIVQFENLIKANYANHYDKFYRTYWFVKNSVSDTLISVQILSPKQVHSIPNWKCEEQEVDIYNQLNRNKNDAKYPRAFAYNCSKGRFKNLGDPD
jgi:hypothetical protein